MLSAILLSVALLGQVSAEAQGPEEVTAAVAATQPAAQAAPGAEESLVERLRKTRFGKIVEGEEKLQAEDLVELRFWISLVEGPVREILTFIPRLLAAFIFFVIFWMVYRGIRRVVGGSMAKARVDQSIRDMLMPLVKWAILGFGVVIACNQVGIQITALLTGVSIIGLAIGFAAQETLSNFIAGIVIFWDRPFGVGDWIQIDGTYGQVQRVTFRSTRILNHDGKIIILPNTFMLANKVSNHSSNPITRIKIEIGIAYKESIDAARAVLLGLPQGDERLATTPPPSVVVRECAGSSVNLVLRLWVLDESIEMALQCEYLEKAKKALDAAGIQIPFPHMQIFLEQTEAVRMLANQPAAPRAA
jgi:small conductance mechanosensitive channel